MSPELTEVTDLQQLVPVEALIREPMRRVLTGISYTTWWRLEKAGRAPRRIRITPDIHGWRLTELQAWVRERVNNGPVPLAAYYKDDRRNGA
jgi:prophage regulatory protein